MTQPMRDNSDALRYTDALQDLWEKKVDNAREDLAVLETRILNAQDALQKLELERQSLHNEIYDAVADIGFLHKRLEWISANSRRNNP